MTANRTLVAIGAGVIALVVVTLAVVLLTDDRGPTGFPPDSPEAALQAYIGALENGDADAAYAAFSSEVRERVSPEAYERELGFRPNGPAGRPDTRYLVSASAVDGDAARVSVTVEEFYSEGLGGSTNRYDREIHLVREDGAWHIDEPLVWLDEATYLEELPQS